MTDHLSMHTATRAHPGVRRAWPALPAWVAVGLLAGCSQFQPYERPAMPLPSSWPVAPAALPVASATTNAAAATDPSAVTAPAAWSALVTDPALRTLVEQALQNNRDARIARLQVAQVRAQYQIRDAARWPTVNLGLTGSRQTVGENEPIKSTLTSGLQVAGWELDLFGRVESLKEVALAQYLASEETRRSTHLSLAAAVVSGWLNLQASDALLALTRQTLASREEALRLTQLRLRHGAASALDLRLAESLTESARVALAQQQRQRMLDRHALALLVGQPVDQPLPEAETGTPDAPDAAWQALADVPVGLPSTVLLNRPDIRAAEQQLAAAQAQMGAARAAFFPRVSLTASVGSASSELSGLFKGGTWGWALAPQALLPIFDGGANRAGLESAQAGRDLALAQYEKAIQVAFREVNDALASRGTLEAQLTAQQGLVQAEAERLRLSELRLRQGVASQLEVLDAQRSLFAARQALLQVRFALAQNRVALFKATAGI